MTTGSRTDSPLPVLKSRAPFRVGVTSYVFPDDILPNVEQLAGSVDDIELVLFESADASNLPAPDVVRRLGEIAREQRLTYTVHLPIDTPLGSPDPALRADALARVLRTIRLMHPLSPFAWLLHFDGIVPGASAGRVAEWQRDLTPALEAIAAEAANPARVCVENLDYPFDWCAPLIRRFGFSVCIDAGHLWAAGHDWAHHVACWRPATRVVHLYGTRGGHEHLSLAEADRVRVDRFLASLDGYDAVLTLETFGLDPTRSSMEVLDTWLRQRNAPAQS